VTRHLDGVASLDLAEFIRPGDTIAWGQASAEPVSLTRLLVEQRASLGGARCFIGIPVADTFLPEHADHLSFISYCATGSNRALHDAGVLDIVPSAYSTFPDLLRSGALAVDVAMILLSPADEDGRYSFGAGADFTPDMVAGARIVLAEVGEHVPRTAGGATLTDADLDIVVHTGAGPVERAESDPSPAVLQIAARVAELIEDGSTLQYGLGAIPEAVLTLLADRRDLGIHGGMITDVVAELMDSGAISNSRKTLDPGISVAGLLIGSRRLFDFAGDNPGVCVRETRYTHDPEILAAQDRLVAINSALEVDLTGQVNSESIDGRYLGAVGGAGDFLRGAARSHGGVPVIALSSSRIVSSLSGPVSIARADAGMIVTEFGTADLRGQSLERRRELMIQIAHPDARGALDASAPVLTQVGR
jgi:acyl-CoA hydrolase